MDDLVVLEAVPTVMEAALICEILRDEGIKCLDRPTNFGAGWNWIQSDNMIQKVVNPGATFGFDHYWLGPVLSSGFALS